MVLCISNGFAQTPSNCTDYTTVGTTTDCSCGSGCTIPGLVPCDCSASWTGFGCAGFVTSTVVGPPVSCLVWGFVSINTDDYGTISTNTGGVLTITAVNANVVGNVVGPYTCVGSSGAVSITICSTIPFTTVTVTNTGCSSGWVSNCSSQTGCGVGGGNAGADDFSTVMCAGIIDMNTLVTGDPGGAWIETTSSGQFNTVTGDFDVAGLPIGTYDFEYEVVGGCAGADTALFSVQVVGPADATWTLPGALCANSPIVDLDALVTGTAGGTWSGTGVTGSNFDPASGSQNVTYTVGTAPCDATLMQNIVVTPSLSPAWTSPGTVCETAGTIDLNTLITGDLGGAWSGTGVTGNTFDPAGLNGNIPITYTIGAAPCVGTDMQDIIVNPDVDPTWVAPTTLCTLDPLFDLGTAITGTTGGTWSGTGVTGNNFDPSVGTQTVTYTVGTAPCDEQLALSITVGVASDPSWTTVSLCITGAPVDLSPQITGTTGGTWSGTGMTGSTFDPSSGSQSVTYTVGSGGCISNSTQTVDVYDPQLTMTGTDISCFGLSDGSANVTVAGGSGNYTYSWDSNPVQTTATATNLPAGTYTVTVTDVDGGCTVTASVTIVEPTEITAVLTSVNGCLPNLGAASASTSGGTGPYTYVWNNSPSITETATNLDSAMHTVVITDASGCTYTDSILVQLFPSPVASVTADTTIIYGNPLQLSAGGGISYLWTPNSNIDCDTCQFPFVNPQETTNYCVKVTDINGCIDSTCVLVDVEIICGEVFVPTAFSPNGDGENELECVYSDCIESSTFTIYNRWGEEVFETSNTNVCWDGTWKGKELNSAVFVFILEGYLINGVKVSQKGNISLIR